MKNKFQEFIKHIKTMFYNIVSVQLKKDKPCEKSKEFYINNLPVVLMDTDIMFEQREKRLEKTMTYIVSGKYKNQPFLMVDSVGTQKNVKGEKSFKFRSKLKKLTSTKTETYCCFTGDSMYQHAIDAFDGKCDWLDVNFDFKNNTHVEEIIEIFSLLYNKLEYEKKTVDKICRMYFINEEGVYYYTVDENLNLYDMCEIPNNKFIKPDDYKNQPININKTFEKNQELIDFCKGEIYNLNPYDGIDMKERFSYIVFGEDEKLLYNSINNNDELVLSMVNANYTELK